MNNAIQSLIHSIYQEGLEKGIDSLHGWRRTVFLIVDVHIMNEMEGFEGLYFSTLAPLASEIASALEAIGAIESSRLVSVANSLLAKRESAESFSQDQMAEINQLASSFCALSDERHQKLEIYVVNQLK